MKQISLKMVALIAAMMMNVMVQGQALNDSLSTDTACGSTRRKRWVKWW